MWMAGRASSSATRRTNRPEDRGVLVVHGSAMFDRRYPGRGKVGWPVVHNPAKQLLAAARDQRGVIVKGRERALISLPVARRGSCIEQRRDGKQDPGHRGAHRRPGGRREDRGNYIANHGLIACQNALPAVGTLHDLCRHTHDERKGYENNEKPKRELGAEASPLPGGRQQRRRRRSRHAANKRPSARNVGRRSRIRVRLLYPTPRFRRPCALPTPRMRLPALLRRRRSAGWDCT